MSQFFIKSEEMTCNCGLGPDCFCQYSFYQIRPYTFEFLNYVNSFFYILIYSRLPQWQIEAICAYLYSIMIDDYDEIQRKRREDEHWHRTKFFRFKDYPKKKKKFFAEILDERFYLPI